MIYKKVFICLICIFLVITIAGFLVGRSSEKRDINLMEINQSEDRESEYYTYISENLASEIEKNYEFINSEIDITHIKDEVISVDVYISGKDAEITETMEEEIKLYVSQYLGISIDYVNIYF